MNLLPLSQAAHNVSLNFQVTVSSRDLRLELVSADTSIASISLVHSVISDNKRVSQWLAVSESLPVGRKTGKTSLFVFEVAAAISESEKNSDNWAMYSRTMSKIIVRHCEGLLLEGWAPV